MCSSVLYSLVSECHLKVGDGSLSRDMWPDAYQNMGVDVLMPIRWMALESLLDLRFDNRTDVVS